MLNPIVLTFSIIALLYLLGLVVLLISWRRPSKRAAQPEDHELPTVTIIIPVRNEEQHISLLLEDLRRQEYPTDKLEVMVVNDQSTDGTEETFARVVGGIEHFTWLSLDLPDDYRGSHKKAAITKGVSNSEADLIIVTDGDCCVGKNWAREVAANWLQDGSVFLSGPVAYITDGSFEDDILTIEFASLIGVGGATMRLGWPTMSNGANMAFSREAFHEVGGYEGNEHIPSGDDEYLMRKLHRHYPGKLRFMKFTQSVVYTDPPTSWGHFFQQRLRWAGKWRYHRSWGMKFLAIFIFLIHASLIGYPVWALIEGLPLLPWLVTIGLKLLFEWVFLSKVVRLAGHRFSIMAFGVLQLTYSLYAVIFGLAAQWPFYSWKGRKYRHSQA